MALNGPVETSTGAAEGLLGLVGVLVTEEFATLKALK
jgi:hypothetical protein